MFTMYTLQNGVTVLLAPQKGAPSATVLVMFPVGSRYEPTSLQGVSHYIEHLMFKGTKKRKNTLTLTREIDRLGAEYNAFTGKEYTGYYIKADMKYVAVSLDILSDMLFNSLFDQKEMEREKGPIIEELKMYRDNPVMNIDNIFEDLLFEGCTLGRDIGGTDDHVRGFKRTRVLEYKKKHYHPGNMFIVISGGFDESIHDLTEKFFGSQRGARLPARRAPKSGFGSGAHDKRLVIQHKKTDQAQLMLGFPAFAYTHKKNAQLDVMNTVFGGSMSSRLFIRIRERLGLAYMIRSGSESFDDIGYTYVRAGLDAKNINKAIRVIGDEIGKMVEKGISARELSDAKTHIRGGLGLSMENSGNLAQWYGKEALFANKVHTPECYLDDIDSVTRNQVHAVASQVLQPKKMRLAVIGDIEKSAIDYV
jgi:predicted Zn-dependent peptidase